MTADPATKSGSRAETKPFFHADHVGSLLRPAILHEARWRFAKGEIKHAELRAVEDDCIRAAIRLQEEVGLPVVTDGEFRRSLWWRDFIEQIPGIRIGGPDTSAAFHKKDAKDQSHLPRIVETRSRISHERTILDYDFTFIKRHATAVPKVTLPSPSRIHFHGGRAAVDRGTYPTMEAFWTDVVDFYRREIAALEALGCRYIQIDDPVLTYFLDGKLRDLLRARGEDPDATLEAYVRAINEIVARRRPDTLAAIHICRGNARSTWLVEGAYAAIAERIFPALAVDAYLLEYDDDRSGDFVPLQLVPRDRKIVLGLITTKHGKLETIDQIRRRIDEAARHFPLANLSLSPQCGFASTAEGNLIEIESQRAKLALVVDSARAVWGGV